MATTVADRLMSKVTDKFQIMLPKALAERYGIRPGDDIRFEATAEAIRLLPARRSKSATGLDIAARLRLFDAATARQRARQADKGTRPGVSRGWTRGGLYDRDGSDTD